MFLRHISKQTVALAAVMSLVAMSVTSWPTDGSAHAQDGDLEVVLKQEKSATTHSAVAKVASSARSSTSTPAKLSHEARITNALKSRTRLQFEDSPLTEVLDVVAQQHGIQIVVDEEGLHSEGMTPDSPVTLRVQDIRLENALTLMLRPKRLAAILTEEVLLVTSQQIADAYSTSTIVYPFDPKIWATEDLVNLVRSKVEPTSWEETGGRGSITGIEGGLVVRQPKRVHEELRNLLQQLADHARFQHALQSGNR